MMYLPPPQPALNHDIRVSGDVEIHPTASLAPGVILQAAPNSRIVIGADACVGMGVIINAYQGAIEIGSGAILGSGVLIIGKCKIGDNCCIGTSTTIFQKDVAAMSVVEPGSIIGDASRPVELGRDNSQNNGSKTKSPTSHLNGNSNSASDRISNNRVSEPEVVAKGDRDSASVSPDSVESTVQKPKDSVVGQVYINELLVTLFPHKKGSNSDSQNSSK